MAKMTNADLLTIITNHRKDSIGEPGSEQANDMANALSRYHGRPYGDEEEGRSQVVAKDLSQTIDWIMPVVMEAIMAGGEVVQFTPVGPEDEIPADNESSYINHVIMNDNEGYILMHDAIHDALLLRNGYWKHYWDETESVKEREWNGMTELAMVKLFQDLEVDDAEVDILGQEESKKKIPVQLEDGGEVVQEITVFDLRLKITKKKQRVTIFAVPKEEIRVSKECTGSLQNSPYVEHVTTKKRYELVEMGMPIKFVKDLPVVKSATSDNTITKNRTINANDDPDGSTLWIDASMEKVSYTEAYLLVDYDKTDKAQLRKVVTAGGKIPENTSENKWNEVIDTIPITGFSTKRMPHRHSGISIDDDLKELQRIDTVLYRQLLDNIYRTNNIEAVMNERVFKPDTEQSLPGGKIRITDSDPVQGAYMQIPVETIVDKILPAMDFFDRVKGNRTGVNDVTKAQDPDVIKKSTKGAFMESLDRSSQIVRMLIRNVAEIGVKELVTRVHEIVSKNQDIPRKIKLNGSYEEIDPRQWSERTDMRVRVGLGTGTKEEKRQNLMLLTSMQDRLIQMGLVTEKKAYDMYKDLAKTLDELNADKYAVDPVPGNPEYDELLKKQQAAKESETNPLAEAEQVKGQMQIEITKMKEIQKGELARVQQEATANLTLFKEKVAAQNKEADRQVKLQIEDIRVQSKESITEATLEVTALIEGFKVDIGKQGTGGDLNE